MATLAVYPVIPLLAEGGLNEYQFAVFSKGTLRSAATALVEAEPKYPETG